MHRRAAPSDLPRLLPLIRRFYEVDRHVYDEQLVVGALEPLLADDSFGQVWVAEREDELIGYAVVTWSYALESGGRDCILDEIYVEPRSTGVGGELIATAIDGAAAFGARVMFLETEAHNVRVRGFYRRHGFEVDDSVWMSRSLLTAHPPTTT